MCPTGHYSVSLVVLSKFSAGLWVGRKRQKPQKLNIEVRRASSAKITEAATICREQAGFDSGGGFCPLLGSAPVFLSVQGALISLGYSIHFVLLFSVFSESFKKLILVSKSCAIAYLCSPCYVLCCWFCSHV